MGRGGRRLKTTKSTPEKKRRRGAGEWIPTFLATLRNSGNVRLACQKAGIDRKTAYKWKERSREFREQWQEALDDACDVLEAEAWNRARGGSDLLLIFLLKAHRPDIYRETTRHEVTGAGGKPIQIKVAAIRQKRWKDIQPTLRRVLMELPADKNEEICEE